MEQAVLKRLQQMELQILTDFDHYCKDFHLRYYLIGGALLGSARYQGFIPWDDDIDVAMPREDYEKLKTVWNTSHNTDYFLQNYESDPNFARCIMKLRKNGTSIIENTSRFAEMNTGIYIDIFPIDYLPELDFNEIGKRANKIRKLMSFRAIKTGYVNGHHQVIKKIIKYMTFFVKNRIIDKKIDVLCSKDNNVERRYAILFLHNYHWKKQLHNVDVFGNGSLCVFEGHKFVAPAKKEEFLVKVFGEDYMNEPSVSKQISPHNYISVEFDKNVGEGNDSVCKK